MSAPKPQVEDRRVRRSRSALMAAAVRLVSEQGTTAIPVAEFTDAADVSRKLLYLHFADRDGLLVAAALDLVERDLLVRVAEAGGELRAQLLATASHFAQHRLFYRPMLTGTCAFAVTSKLNALFGSLSTHSVRQLYDGLDPHTAEDVGIFFAGGASALVHDWVINASDPLDPVEMAGRLHRINEVFRSRGGTP